MLDTYTALDGRTYNLSRLTECERAYLTDAYATFGTAPSFVEFMDSVVHGTPNPLLAKTGGWVTNAVWHHPLYRALRDLAARLGVE